MKKVSLLLVLSALLFSCGTGEQQQEEVSRSGKEVIESEHHRPQFHFTPSSAWMNDPNGMVYHNGEYHLFYQHNPDSTVWGPMHWGHAVSTDMVHWEHLPIGLYPDSLGTIFSGSAVVDVKNTSGLGTADNPPMVAIFTYHSEEKARAGRKDFQTQGIAFSVNNGRSWTKYEGNPVLPNPGFPDFRDPKVMWYEKDRKWVMTLAVQDHISFYSSPDLKNWKHESDFGQKVGAHGGVWECPDLFEVAVEGSNDKKWVLLVSINPGGPNGGSATQYFVGKFDGKNFILDQQFQQQLLKEAVIPSGKLLADFEGNSYKSWEAEGEAFGQEPAGGSIGNQGKVNDFAGKGLVNSFRNGDASTGKLVSPAFTIDADYINLLIGGGKHPNGTAVNLVVDNQVVQTATGNNSESLEWKSLGTKDLKGQKAKIEIVDNETGGWGHILVDQIMLANAPAIPGEDGVWIDYGTDNYAGVSWSNVPEEDGRRLFLGWMSNWLYANVVPTERWRSAMTIPRNLTLENTEAGLRIVSKPVEELENLRKESHILESFSFSDVYEVSEKLSFNSATFELEVEIHADKQSKGFIIELSNDQNEKISLGFDAKKNQYFIDRTEAGKSFSVDFPGIHYGPKLTSGNTHSIRLFADVASVEFFAGGGKTVMTEIFFPEEVFTNIRLISIGSKLEVPSLKVHNLKSIYKNEIVVVE